MLYRITKVFTSVDSLKRTLQDIEVAISFEPLTSRSSSLIQLHPSPTHTSPVLNTSSSGFLTAGDHSGSPSRTSLSSSSVFLTRPDSSPLIRTVSSSRHPQEFPASGLKLANIRQLMQELEGPDFTYVSLFSDDNREKVSSKHEILR